MKPTSNTPFILSAEYTGSYAAVADLPKSEFAEIVFAGRSNVGKSSLINYLTNKKEMARTSSQPGKTQTFNFYLINKNWFLVDLPGYGFAKVPMALRKEWEERMYGYFRRREQLTCICQLVDARIPPQKSDLLFSERCLNEGMTLAILFTKADRKFKNDTKKNISAYQDELLKNRKMLPTVFITSASDKTGADDVLDWIKNMIAV